MEPNASLFISKPYNHERKRTDVAHIAGVLGVEPNMGRDLMEPEPWHTGFFGVWMLSTDGLVQSSSIRVHVRWLLDAVGGYSALEPLQAEGYWPSVYFFDTNMPDPAEKESVMLELEQHAITFDFELEREDFP